jgi:exodeoxyribonuclease VIII
MSDKPAIDIAAEEVQAPPETPATGERGIFVDVPFDEYLTWPGLNKSRLWTMNEKTPLHYKWELDNPSEVDTEALLIGRAGHAALWEPDKFVADYARPPDPPEGEKWDRRKKSHKDAWTQFEEASTGKIILTAAQYEAAWLASDAARLHPCAARTIEASTPEVSIQWRDRHTGLLLKGRIDGWAEAAGVIVDTKFVECAAPRPFANAAGKYGWHFQLAMYYDGMRELTARDVALPILIAVEKRPPYAVACYELDEDALAIGRDCYKTILMDAKACAEAGRWPGYSNALMLLDLPPWIGTTFRSYSPPQVNHAG